MWYGDRRQSGIRSIIVEVVVIAAKRFSCEKLSNDLVPNMH